MSTMRLPGEAGIIPQTEITPIDIIPNQQQEPTPTEATPTMLERLRSRWTTLVAIGTVALTLGTVHSLEERPAYAANTETAVIGMPFAGKWSTYVHPSTHDNYSADWATDIYAAPGTEARLKVGNVSGNATYTTSNVEDTSCGAGKRVRVNVKVDNVPIGWVQYEHLDTALGNDVSLNPGDLLGTTKKWRGPNDEILPCYQVSNDTGVHLHIGMKNVEDKRSCYVGYETQGAPLTEGANLGVIGSPNEGAKQACASIPGEIPINPYDQNIKINADGRGDLVTARAVGGFVVGYGAPNGTLTEGPLSLANWTVNSWAGTGDFNGDGHTDNLVAMPNGGFGVALGHANGVFTEGGVTLPGWGIGNWAGTGNFYKNGNDSRSDLVVARATGGFAVAYGMPNGTLTEGPISLPNWNVTSWAGAADLNGDNYTDILVAKPAGGFDIALGQSNGVFVEGGSTLAGWGPGTWAGLGNFAGNARHDLVIARPQGGFVVAHANTNGTLNEGPVSLTNWTVPSWAGTGDFNGDGYTDILVAQPNGGFAVALGHADGFFTEGGVTLPGWGPGKWAGNGAFVGSRGYGYVRP